MSPSLSVCIPNYNHANFLERCLSAVMLQDRLPDEVIVYDDASTDNSLNILINLQKRWPLIRVEQGSENKGALNAINTLAGIATGDYMHTLAADDVALPAFYRLAMKEAERYPQAGALFGDFIADVENNDGRWVKNYWVETATPWIDPGYQSPQDMIWKLFHKVHAMFGTYAYILRRRAFEEQGGLLPELKAFADNFAFRCITARHGAVYLSHAPLLSARVCNDSESGRLREGDDDHAQVIKQTANLMRTQYGDIFPARFTRHWEARYLEALGVDSMSPMRWLKLATVFGLRLIYIRGTRLLGR